MAGKCRKRKRAAAASPPRDLAAKKRHVRELAMAGRWQEIKRHYGSKMVARGRAYAEKQRAEHTPQSLALEVLRRNGYLSSDSVVQPTAVSLPSGGASSPPEPGEGAPQCRDAGSDCFSPGDLTSDQREMIERRRREALERRRRKDALAACAVTASEEPQIIRQNGKPSWQLLAPTRAPTTQLTDPPRCAVPVADPPDDDEEDGYAHNYLISTAGMPGLTIAEHYVAEVEFNSIYAFEDVPMPENTANAVTPPTYTSPTGTRQNSRLQPSISISQELAAAADIIMWEQKQESTALVDTVVDEMPVSAPQSTSKVLEDDFEIELPRFTLLSSAEEPANQDSSCPHILETISAVMTPAKSIRRAPADPTQSLERTQQNAAQSIRPPTEGSIWTTTCDESSRTGAKQAPKGPGERAVQPKDDSGSSEASAEKIAIEMLLLDDVLDMAVLQFVDMILS